MGGKDLIENAMRYRWYRHITRRRRRKAQGEKGVEKPQDENAENKSANEGEKKRKNLKV